MARDIVQDTFLKLWQADRGELDGRLAPWLYRVCRNRAVDVLRKDRRMTTLGNDALPMHAAPASGETPANTSGARLTDLMHTLPDRQQEVLRLKFHGGLSYRQIADVMGLSVGNVGFLLHTSIKALRDQLAAPRDASSGPATEAAR